MTTARKIITKAMQRSGILTKTETPADDEANDVLDTLNDMLSSWSNESLLIYTRAWESFSLSGGVSEYTIGTGATFDTTRPILVVSSYVRNGTSDTDVTIIDDTQYNMNIAEKTSSGLPFWLNYDNNFPTAKIRLWPVPSTAYTLFILSEKELAQFSLDDTVSLPPGWRKALIYNLAVELSPDYGQEVDPFVLKQANEAKANIKLAIMKTRMMNSAPLTGGIRNIYTGYET